MLKSVCIHIHLNSCKKLFIKQKSMLAMNSYFVPIKELRKSCFFFWKFFERTPQT